MWTEIIERYAIGMAAAGRSAGTIRLHRHYLRDFARANPRPLKVSRDDIERWLARPGWSPETRKSARAVIVGFYRWMALTERMGRSPARDLAPVTVPPAVARPAPEPAYLAALVGADRDLLLMLTLARHAGLRCAEIAGIHSENLDGDLLYIRGKGGRFRVVPIEKAELVTAIATADGYLFPSPEGGHFTAGWVSKRMSRALGSGVTGHQLRHAFATRSYEGNPDLLALGRVLGHSKPETTMRYVATPESALRRVVHAAA